MSSAKFRRAVRESVAALALVTLSPAAVNAEPVRLARPALRAFANLPAGVPPGYVLTRGGLFHPSCVVTVHAGETVGADRIIRGPDGSERRRVAPCAYPRFSMKGALRAAPSGPSAQNPAPAHAPSAYDGWIISYDYIGSLKNQGQALTLSDDMLVPLEPKKTGPNQDVAFFNGFETNAGTDGDILQPVLDFGAYGLNWAIESEHCCLDNNDMQTDPIAVKVGDLIRGIVAGTGCDATGVCSAWKITTLDVTSGESTVLNTTAPMGAIEEVNAAVLETYGVSSCDMLPANGEITFFNHSVLGGTSQPQPLTYDFVKDKPMTAEFPTDCGFRGEKTNDSYTLIFSNEPVNVGGAPSMAGPSGSAGAGGNAPAAGAGGTLSSGGPGGSAEAGAGTGGVAGVAISAAGAAGVPPAVAGEPGHDSQAGSSNSGGSAGGLPSSSAGAAAVPPANGRSDANGSCSCGTAAPESARSLTPWALLLGLVGLLRARRQRSFGHGVAPLS